MSGREIRLPELMRIRTKHKSNKKYNEKLSFWHTFYSE